MLIISQNGLTPSRSINNAHVAKLKKVMSKNIERAEPQYRMRINMKLADYERTVAHSVHRNAFWSGALHRANVKTLMVEKLDKKMRDEWNRRIGTLQDFVLMP
jgi:hypothetical protein